MPVTRAGSGGFNKTLGIGWPMAKVIINGEVISMRVWPVVRAVYLRFITGDAKANLNPDKTFTWRWSGLKKAVFARNSVVLLNEQGALVLRIANISKSDLSLLRQLAASHNLTVEDTLTTVGYSVG